ncbi:MAG: hypothetical protein ACFFBL_04015 [Promethearchaeota archaeon]
MVKALAYPRIYFNGNLSSRTSIMYVDRGYAADRHEFERNAKPWSELFEPLGPGLKSSLSPSPTGETKTRSLDQRVNSTIDKERKGNDSSTPAVVHPLIEETTTFSKAATRYIYDILLLTQQS